MSEIGPSIQDRWLAPKRCLYCHSEDFTPRFAGIRDRLHYVPGEFAFVECRGCGSLHLSRMPPLDEIPGLYPPIYLFRQDFETASRLKGRLALLEERFFYRYLFGSTVRLVKKYTGMSGGVLLDVGCGTGSRLTGFAAAGFTVRGLEVQPELVDYVRGSLGCEADIGTLETMAYQADSFDLVALFHVLEHILDVRSTLRHSYRILKPGGWLVAEVPLADSLQMQWLKQRWGQLWEAPRHVTIPTQRGLSRAICEYGFEPPVVHPSSALTTGGLFALSLVPSANTTHSYSSGSLLVHVPRFIAGCLTLLYSPVALLERYLRRPASGYVLARKPQEALA